VDRKTKLFDVGDLTGLTILSLGIGGNRLQLKTRKGNLMLGRNLSKSEADNIRILLEPFVPSLPTPDKFYKRGSQEKYFSGRRNFSYFPAPVNERGRFASSAACARFVAQPSAAVRIISVSGFHRIVATKPIHI
jgi:hypothetical protein